MSRGTALVTLAVFACGGGDDSTAPPVVRTGIRIVSGANVTDSVDAILPQRLVVEVRDAAGKLVPVGTAVQFKGVPNGGGVGSVGAFVYNTLISTFFPVETDSTDQAGRAGTMVQLGPFAAPAIIVISVPSLNVSDTARYTVVAGAAAQVGANPKDTVVFVGRSYSLRGQVGDRHNNPRSDPVTWTSSASGISVTSAGAVTTSAPGRYSLTATSQSLSASSSVSVVPLGTLAVWNLDGSYISSVDLDGSNLRILAPVSDGGSDIGPHPSWIPGTDKIIYSTFDGAIHTLRTVDQSGATAPFVSPGTPNVSHRIEPIPSPDGRWMFFSAFDTQCWPDSYCVYRSAIDGSAAQLLGSVMRPGGLSWQPAPSPDGAKLAFVTSSPSSWIIFIFDIATKSIAPLGAIGQNPRWSRAGNQIAFVPNGGGPLRLMNSDGTNQRPLTAPNTRYREQPLTWSPDNRWIVARNDSILDLIDVASGATIPLVYSGKLWAPSWK